MRKLLLALGVPLFALATPASAHFNLTMPPSIAQSTEGGKGAPPCGPDSSGNGPVTAATGGQPLTVHIDETVGHKGFYRFALALKSESEFPLDDLVRDANKMVLPILGPGQSATADYEMPAKFPVIADNVFLHTNTVAQSFPSKAVPGQVILPNVTCDKCILQVDEFMAEHPSNGVAGYYYHHCAYLKITADPTLPVFDPSAGAGGSSGAGVGGGSGNSGAAGSSGLGGTSGNGVSAGGADTVAGGADTVAGSGGVGGVSAAGGMLATAGSPGVAGFSAAGSSGASSVPGGEPPSSSDGGCSIDGRPPTCRPALCLGLLALLGSRRRRGRSLRGNAATRLRG